MWIEILNNAEKILREAGVSTPRLDAEVLLAHTLNCERYQLYTNDSKCQALTASHEHFNRWIARRKKREPVAYILGHKEFWSLKLKVTPDVLIPRPETEKVVEAALEFVSHQKRSDTFRILDLCTGSGAIAAALATELPCAQFVVSDISKEALEVAKENLKFAEGRTTFLQSNLFEKICGPFDLIVSNPPYIKTGEICDLMPEILSYEPRSALDGGAEGLDFVYQIRHHFSDYIHPSGCLILENRARVEIWKNSSSKGATLFREQFV